MCATQTVLHQNDIGSVSICNGCEHIHIEIGNFMTVLCPHAFELIIEDFNTINSNIENYTLSTPSGEKVLTRLTDNSFISQDPDDFEETLIMFEMANHFLKAKQILNS
jgi:hypothetical protein